MTRLIIGAAFLAAFGIGPAAAIAVARPVAGAPLLVVTPPWVDPAATVEAAGGRVIGLGRAPLAVLAAGDAELADRLLDAGAWLVRDGTGIKWMCGGPNG
ncbi:hypothetical protein [Roseitranquillus sediminis]|uniref:hypothetical protein n=1 Tax=Roseitranquillus sediminis TaxID=2809051 RepID=UPI001D0C9741|nr:hypothetical protein [Roseitranquillus sediminis]MBM9595725.1 hypothetical protein [Roseitranquillus sediminis]